MPAAVWWLVVLFLLFAVVYPMAVLIGNSFLSGSKVTLAHYARVFTDSSILQSILNSLKVVIPSTILSTVIGISLAWICCRTGLPGRRLCRRNDALTLTEPEATPLPERMLVPGGTLLLPEAGLVCECRECAPGEEIQISFNTFSFSCANICGKLTITRRFAGDKLSLWGGRGTHSVKKWMIEAKIPRAERESVPVVRDEQGILAVYGMGQGQRAAARPGEAFLQILFNKISEDI